MIVGSPTTFFRERALFEQCATTQDAVALQSGSAQELVTSERIRILG